MVRVATPWLEPACVQQFNRVLQVTEARVVISSSWRQIMIPQDGETADMTAGGFTTMLRTHGITGLEILGHIGPDTDTRGALIREWLNRNARFGPHVIDRYVVLDDCDHGISSQSLPFVLTNPNEGLTVEAANDVIRLLNRE